MVPQFEQQTRKAIDSMTLLNKGCVPFFPSRFFGPPRPSRNTPRAVTPSIASVSSKTPASWKLG